MEPIILTEGERELRRYTCFSVAGGEGDLVLTTSRLICRTEQKYDKDNTGTQRFETELKSIKSITSSYATSRPPSKGAPKIIIGVILLIAAIVLFLQSDDVFKVFGGVSLAIAIVLIIVGAIKPSANLGGSLVIELDSNVFTYLIISSTLERNSFARGDKQSINFAMAVRKEFVELQAEIGAVWQSVR